MNIKDLLEKYSPFLKQHKLPLILASLALIFFIYGLIALIGSSNSSDDVVLESGHEEVSGSSTKEKEIVVDVEGAVVKPGVYSLGGSARIQEALVLAGGLSASADRSWVAKNLNLAAKLSDGAKVYIPSVKESIPTSPRLRGASTGGMETANAGGQININSASIAELDSLTGVGPVTAQKIIDNRPYSSIQDLADKKVVSQRVWEGIKDKVTTY